mgnify:CR=1 FL=1
MTYIELYQIINDLAEFNPKKAKKLQVLVDSELREQDQTKKRKISQKINNYVYNLFMSCLSKKTRQDMYNTSQCINEECYSIEQDANDGWYIMMDGAKRYSFVGDELTVISEVPRTYKGGFYLKERNPETEEERISQLKEAKFFARYHSHLDQISTYMDHKQELTSNYELSDSRIPKEFVEKLITVLKLTRVPGEELKQQKS